MRCRKVARRFEFDVLPKQASKCQWKKDPDQEFQKELMKFHEEYHLKHD